jgi:hypothetical protein
MILDIGSFGDASPVFPLSLRKRDYGEGAMLVNP